MKPMKKYYAWLAHSLAAVSTIACGGGDGGPQERAHPGQYQTPSQGVAQGPDGEVLRLGTDPGTNSQEQQPATPEAPSATNCEDATSCEAVCRCLGQSQQLCENYCNAYYQDGNGNDISYSDTGLGESEACASLNDPCLSCLCEAVDLTACSTECAY